MSTFTIAGYEFEYDDDHGWIAEIEVPGLESLMPADVDETAQEDVGIDFPDWGDDGDEAETLPPGFVYATIVADNEDVVPTEAQVAATERFLKNQEQLLPIIKTALTQFCQQELDNGEFRLISPLPTARQLVETPEFTGFHVRDEEVDGLAIIGLTFEPFWAIEGVGLVLHGERVVAAGSGDIVVDGPHGCEPPLTDDEEIAELRGRIVAVVHARNAELQAIEDARIAADPYLQFRAALDDNNYDQAESLLNDGVDINMPRDDCDHPLCCAVAEGRVDQVEWLLAHGSAADAETKSGDSALAIAMGVKTSFEMVSNLRDTVVPMMESQATDAEAQEQIREFEGTISESLAASAEFDRIIHLLEEAGGGN